MRVVVGFTMPDADLVPRLATLRYWRCAVESPRGYLCTEPVAAHDEHRTHLDGHLLDRWPATPGSN